MRFIKDEELKIRKFQSLINDVGEDNQFILNELEEMSIDEITSYLRPRYDTEFIFNREGSDRSALIKRITIDFMMCYLWERTNSNEIPDSLLERCDKNTQWLKDVSAGKISPDFPQKNPDLELTNIFQGGSEPVFNDTDSID